MPKKSHIKDNCKVGLYGVLWGVIRDSNKGLSHENGVWGLNMELQKGARRTAVLKTRGFVEFHALFGRVRNTLEP